MRKWKQRLWSLLLCGAMLVSLCVTAEAVEVVDSGEFPGIDGGSPWRWELDRDGVLTIDPGLTSSPRPMPDFTPSGSPWYGKADQIESVVFAYADSVTTIGHYAFRNCRNLTEITLPDGLTTIEFGAFELCTSLKEITLPDSLTTIGLLAFAHCTDLTSITFTSDTPPRINGGAFDGCDSLTEIRVPAGAEVAYREELSKAGLVLDGGGIELKVEYSITVTATEGGTAYASPDFAAAGEEIILTAKPDRGISR